MLRCGECGWEGPKAKTLQATKRLPERVVCPDCGGKKIAPVPLNERPGRCHVCAGTSFRLYFDKGNMLRQCRECKAKYDVVNMKPLEG